MNPYRIGLAILAALTVGACTRVESPPEPSKPKVECTVQLRSWVVAGRGRHLFLDCDCPDGYERLEHRIEYTSANLRRDFDPTRDPAGIARIARMTPGLELGPLLGERHERLEAEWRVGIDVVECLQRDAVFTAEYRLLGPNSNSGIRAIAEACGLPFPDRVLTSGGMLGEFPGIEMSPGSEIPRELWDSVGVLGSPEPSE